MKYEFPFTAKFGFEKNYIPVIIGQHCANELIYYLLHTLQNLFELSKIVKDLFEFEVRTADNSKRFCNIS